VDQRSGFSTRLTRTPLLIVLLTDTSVFVAGPTTLVAPAFSDQPPAILAAFFLASALFVCHLIRSLKLR